MNIGKSLKIAMAKRECKSIELAEKLNTSPQQVSNWINCGSMKQSTLIKISEVLGMQVSEFIALGES
jgi:transcriptional regulator with XRE-family HTH domain